jgi:hypothetical protein
MRAWLLGWQEGEALFRLRLGWVILLWHCGDELLEPCI